MKGKAGFLSLLGMAFAFAYFALAVDLERTYYNTNFYIFQARDLFRASRILAGQAIFFGPEMTGGGNLFGPLYYYLLATTQFFSEGWESAWWLMVAMSALSGVVGWAYLRWRCSSTAALLWLGVFGTAQFTGMFLRIFMNVSYLTLFAMLALVAICESFLAPTERERNRAFWLGCLLVSIGSHFHLSIVFWLPVLMAGRFTRARSGKSRLPELIGAVCLLVPIAPYLFWLALGRSLGDWQTAPSAGETRDVVPVLLSYIENLRSVPLLDTLYQGVRLLEVIPLPLFILCFFLLKLVRARKFCDGIERPLLLLSAAGFVPFSYYFVAPIAYRYSMLVYLPAAFLTAVLLEKALNSRERMLAFVAVSLAAFVLLLAFFPKPLVADLNLAFFLHFPLVALLPAAGVFFLRPIPGTGRALTGAAIALSICLCLMQRAYIETGFTNSNSDNVGRLIPNQWDWIQIWREVHTRTGWSYDTAISRMYFVNHHMEQDARPAFDRAVQWSEPPAPGTEIPDGFLVSMVSQEDSSLLHWLLEQPIQEELKEGIRSGKVLIGEKSILRGLLLVPYKVLDAKALPKGFHDSGMGYVKSAEVLELEKTPVSAEAQKLSDERLLFRWNDCPELSPSCTTAAMVSVTREGKKWNFRVRVIGFPISQVSPWIFPKRTENWQRPYLEVSCAGKDNRFLLATSIGYNRRYGSARENFPFNYDNAFVAPFERSFTVACGSRPSLVKVGREGTEVEGLRGVTRLPARALELVY